MSQLESLVNELVFDIFEHLNTAHLLHAFLGLNSRFNQLLYAHFRIHQFNLQSITNYDFEVLRQQHLSILTKNLTSLRLSNDNETPNLCEHFLSSSRSINRFIHLKSLSLCHIKSLYVIDKIIVQCRSLTQLKHLNLIGSYFDQQPYVTSSIINSIWKIPNLTHCTINTLTFYTTWIYQLSAVSTSIEFLAIDKIEGCVNMLDHLMAHTPQLQQLNTNVIYCSECNQPDLTFPSIIALKTSFTSNIDTIVYLFNTLPNLSHLTLEICRIYLDGYDWEQILVNCLPKIKTFRLKMNLILGFDGHRDAEIDQILNSFRTPFWLEERQWYVRCDWYSSSSHKGSDTVLYTLPYTFHECSFLNIRYSKSTKPNDEEFPSLNSVRSINQKNIQIDSFNDLNRFNIRFPNTRHFEITLPLTNDLNALHSSFNQLTSLHVKLNNIFGYEHLQTLLNRAHRLYSLRFDSFGESLERLFHLTSASIRQLDLMVDPFNHEDCVKLINSPLGRQCEVLLMIFKRRKDILYVIDGISSLRVLTFLHKNLALSHLKSSSINKSLIRWLEGNLIPTSSIITDEKEGPQIHLWIYRNVNKTLSINDDTSRTQCRMLSHFQTKVRRFYPLHTFQSN